MLQHDVYCCAGSSQECNGLALHSVKLMLFWKGNAHLLLFYQCLLLLQARHGQLNAMGWFGNIGIASPAGPSDLHSDPDAMLNSEHLLISFNSLFQWLSIICRLCSNFISPNCLLVCFNNLLSVFQLFPIVFQ